MRENKLFIICPCYNEEEILNDSINKLKAKMNELIKENLISKNSKLVLIDDGSTDNTWMKILEFTKSCPLVIGIKLSRNFGQYAAIMAGYMYAKDNADICISLDVDLQDDISALDHMLKEYHNGSEVVLAVRSDRKEDGFMKRITASLYYKIIKILGSKMIPEHPDYRLLSKKALCALSLFHDKSPYLRGMIPSLGFKTALVGFERKRRTFGKTSYNYYKLLKIGISGIVKTSNRLLYTPLIAAIIAILGLFISIPIQVYWFLLFLSIWIIGLYIIDIKEQVYDRPSYIIETIEVYDL